MSESVARRPAFHLAQQALVEQRCEPVQHVGPEVSVSALQTASAASTVQPPTKTATRVKSRCSAASSKS